MTTLEQFEDRILCDVVNAMFVGDERGAEEFLEELATAIIDDSSQGGH